MFPLLKPDWMPQSDLFQSVDHICMVVRDLDTVIQLYESLEVRPWKTVSSPAYYEGSYNETDTYSYPGHKFASTAVGGITLVLCQPVEDSSPQWRYLSTNGAGVFYFGFEVLHIQDAEALASRLGLNVEYRCKMADGRKFTKFQSIGSGAVFSFGIKSRY